MYINVRVKLLITAREKHMLKYTKAFNCIAKCLTCAHVATVTTVLCCGYIL